MGNALSARLAAIQSEAERLQALQASAERKAREGLLLQRTADAEHLQQRQEYFIDMISHEVRSDWTRRREFSFNNPSVWHSYGTLLALLTSLWIMSRSG